MLRAASKTVRSRSGVTYYRRIAQQSKWVQLCSFSQTARICTPADSSNNSDSTDQPSAGRKNSRQPTVTRIRKIENEIARREEILKVLNTNRLGSEKKGSRETSGELSKVPHVRLPFVDGLRPLTTNIRLTESGAQVVTGFGGEGDSGSGRSSYPNLLLQPIDISSHSKESTENPATNNMTSNEFVKKAFSRPIREYILNSLVTALVRHTHTFLYSKDPWSEGYSIPLLADAAEKCSANITTLDIPDWSILTSRIDPYFEDLTIVSHPYNPPPDIETGDQGEGSGTMSFFAGIGRSRQGGKGTRASERAGLSSEDSVRGRDDDEDVEGDDSASNRPYGRGIDTMRAQFGGGNRGAAGGDRLAAGDEDASDPVLSREMMSNPLSREATERLDKVLGDYLSTLVTQRENGSRPVVVVVKHMADLMNTRIGYTLFSRLVNAASKHNAAMKKHPVTIVGLMHPSWFDPNVLPPGIPPYDVNPSTPAALVPREDRSEALSRGMNGLVEGLLGSNPGMASSLNGRRVGVHVQLQGVPVEQRISRALGGHLGESMGTGGASSSLVEEVPVFARIGIPPPNKRLMAAECDMQPPEHTQVVESTSKHPIVGTLRQSLVAEQCLERNAKVVRNICLLYRVDGLQLSDNEMDIYRGFGLGCIDADSNQFCRRGLYQESPAPVKGPRWDMWAMDHLPLKIMLSSLPDDIARRFFLGETFLHKWVSLAQALSFREALGLDLSKSSSDALSGCTKSVYLSTRHLLMAYFQVLESERDLKEGFESYSLAEDEATASVETNVKASDDDGTFRLHQVVDLVEIGIGRRAEDEDDVLVPISIEAKPKPNLKSKENGLEKREDGADGTKPVDTDSGDTDTMADALASNESSSLALPLPLPLPRQWAEVSDLLDEELESSGSSRGARNRGAGVDEAVVSAQRRIQGAKKSLNEYEERLVGCIVDPQSIPTGFDQVCIKNETITTLQEIITLPMIRPEYFSRGVLRRYNVSGILLFGPPGTGKTMLAKAVAKESGSIVLNIRASDIYDKYVGEGEKLAEAVFTLARKLAPCVIFIDEVDALFSARSSGESSQFRRDMINQIMSEWDGINTLRKKSLGAGGVSGNGEPRSSPPQVMVMAATNRPFDLDDAILRRLPRRILVDLPGADDRKRILEIHLAGEELNSDVDLEALSQRTESYSGSDLKNLCVAAALAALRERVHEEVVGIPAKQGATLIDQLRRAHEEAGTLDGHKPETIRLSARHFDLALKKVAPSSSDKMDSLVELRKWDKMYGDGAQESKRKQYVIGFGGTGIPQPAPA